MRCSPAELFNLKSECYGHLLKRGLSRLLDPFHLRLCGLGDSDSAGDFCLSETEVLAPGCHGRHAALEAGVHKLVWDRVMGKASLHAPELVEGHDRKFKKAIQRR